MPPVLSRLQGSLVVLFCGLMFSFGPLTFRALRDADAWQFLFHRSWATAVVSAAVIVAAGRNPLRSVVEAGLRQVAAGLVVAALFTLFIVALSRASAAFVLLMQSTSPFYAALFGRIFLKEPVGRDTLMAMVVAAVGVVVMVGGNVGSGDALGTLLSAILPIALGGYAVLIRSSPIRDPGVPMLVGGTAGAVAAAAVSSFGPGVVVPAYDVLMGVIAGGLLIGVFAPVWNYAHRFVPPADVSLLLISEIVMAPVWLWIWRDETPSTETLIGGAISLAAVLWLTFRMARDGEPALSARGRGLHVGSVPGFRCYRPSSGQAV